MEYYYRKQEKKRISYIEGIYGKNGFEIPEMSTKNNLIAQEIMIETEGTD